MAKRNLPPDEAEAAAKAHSATTHRARGKSMVTRPGENTLIWFNRADYAAGQKPDRTFNRVLTDAEVFALLSERKG